MNSLELAQAGAIVTESDPKLDSLSARHYHHPALGERSVVRLVSDTLGTAEDLTLEFHGFTFEQAQPVGYQLRKGLGFPGWALVNDPAHAGFALEVVKQFRAQAKLARSRPGAAKEGFDGIAERLGRSVPHFLPSYFEEAGRVFLENGNVNTAAIMFGKARQAEKVHALSVDESLRREAFLEFTLAGAVSIKTLTEYGKELSAEHNPEQAYHHFRELCLRRTLGGMPPWSGMLKELKRLAKAAGKDLKTEERTLLDEVLSAPAVARSPVEFWSSAKETVSRMCEETPELRKTLLNLAPVFSGDRIKHGSVWLDLLEAWGALKLLETEPGAAAWFSRMIGHFYSWSSSSPNPDQMFGIVRKAAANIISEGEPVVLRDLWRADLDLIEQLLSLGIPVEIEPQGYYHSVFNLVSWAQGTGPERPKDPVHLSRHEALRDYLMKSLDRHYGSEPFDSVSAPMQGWKNLRLTWLEQQVEKLEREALPTLKTTLETWERIAKGRILADYPELRQRLSKLDRSTLLARTLRGFLPEELAWPALEKAVAELGADTAQVDGLFPLAVVYNNVRAIAIGIEGEIARHDITVPKGARLESVAYLDGQFLLRFWGSDGNKAFWSTGQECEIGYFYGDFSQFVCATLPDIGLTYGGQALQAGDSKLTAGGYWRIVCDGETCWKPEWAQGESFLKEFDPRTGNTGRRSWPKFYEEWMDTDSKLDVTASYLFPLPSGLSSSLLGGQHGLAGWRTRERNGAWEAETTAGQAFNSARQVSGLLTVEGAERPLYATGKLANIEHDGAIVCEIGLSPKALVWQLPLHWWHLLKVRDSSDSRALRAVSDSQADALKLKDPILQQAHRNLVTTSKEFFERLESFLVEPEAAGLPSIKAGQVGEILAAFGVRINDAHNLSDEAVAVADMLPAETTTAPKGVLGKIVGMFTSGSKTAPTSLKAPVSLSFIQQCAGHLAAIAWRSVTPFSDPSEREAALNLLSWWVDSPLIREPEKFRRISVKLPEDSYLLALSQGENRYLLEMNYYDGPRYCGLESTNGGKFRVPKGGTLESGIPCTSAWDTSDRLQSFIEVARSRGPIAWNPEHPQRISEITGLSLAESCLLWVGFPHFQNWENNFLPVEIRETMGLKPAEAKIARENLRNLSSDRRLELFSQSMPEKAEELWTDTMACAERLAATWNRLQGARLSVTPEVLKALSGLSHVKPAELLSALADPASSFFGKDGRSTANGWNVLQEPPESFTQTHFGLTLSYLGYFFEFLPVGDPVRQAAVRVWPHIEERLKNPDLLFQLGSLESDDQKTTDHWKSLLGGEDNGTVLMQTRSWGGPSFFYRPAKAKSDDPILKALEASISSSDWGTLQRTRSQEFLDFIDRFENTPVPQGGYETNPLLAVPHLVKEVEAHFEVSENEAILYLQTLTLMEPTSKNIQLWNGWTAAVYKKAAAGLAQRGLLLEAKRARAGRAHFLPGGWLEQRAPQLPFETWKLPLLEIPADRVRPNMGQVLRLTPLHHLFEKAWKRVLAGDSPAYEEVTK